MSAHQERPKALVIGLDGADWRLLEPWLREGHLPALSRLITTGARGVLRSTIRPESSVAWSSFSTGMNAGKHGVFGFVEHAPGSYAFQLANGSSVRARRFWEILGDEDRRVWIYNVPFTYPPAPVNGLLVSGMLTPGPDVAFTHPPDLRGWLLSHFEKYQFDVTPSEGEQDALIASVRAITQQQLKTALLLLHKQPWDLGMVVFTGPDRLQHFLWACHDPGHPLRQADHARLGNALLEHYQLLDEAIAEILDNLPPNTLVLVMSDHGFNGCARRFYVNRWLVQEGYLALHEANTWRLRLAAMTSKLGSVGWIRRLKRALLPARWGATTLRSAMFVRAVDWSRTRAYFGPDGGLRINLAGREPEGIVDPGELDTLRQELRQRSLALVDPDTGQPALSGVFAREELYHGPFTDRAPDLILEPQRDNPAFAHNLVLDGSLEHPPPPLFGSSAPYTGNHTLDGVLIACGPGVTPGQQIVGAQIIDLAPTLLAALGVPIPDTMDGRVLSELFSPGSIPEPRKSAPSEPSAKDALGASYSPEDESTVEGRLRGLGYLD